MSRPTLHTGSVLAHVLPAVVLNSIIALGLTVFGEHGFADNWLYSQCIGLSIGVLILQSSRWFIRGLGDAVAPHCVHRASGRRAGLFAGQPAG